LANYLTCLRLQYHRRLGRGPIAKLYPAVQVHALEQRTEIIAARPRARSRT